MAYTKIIVIHNRLDRCLNYTQDEEKTSLEAVLDYAMNRDKTEQDCFETALNCDRETAYADMMDTKRRWGKTSRKRKGYHVIQSFAPGEVAPEQAHAIGVELAQRLLADKYEVVVSTHLNKAHLHSHIVFNSVSFVDGSMYRDRISDLLGGSGVGIRGTSDAICLEHGLSIIESSEPSVSRAEWEAEKAGKPNFRGLARADIDTAIANAYTMRSFWGELVKMGYLWNENRTQWLVDPEAAEVVKRIFAMTIDGFGPYQIAKKLSEEKNLIPSAYLAQFGEGVNKNKTFKDVYGWGASSVVEILKKREYLGHTVNFKTRKHFKDKKSHYVSEDEWTIFENTHEPIIDQPTFDLVQKIRGNVRRYPNGWGEAAPLTGLLYCADCGGKMYVHRTNNGKRISQYTCSQYSKVPVGKLCTTQHRINEDVVLSLISDMLKAIAEYAKHDRSEFIRVVQEAQSSQQTAEVRKQRTRLATAKQRVSELEVLLCKIYEDNILGKLSDSRYEMLDAQYAKEQGELTAEIFALEKAVKGYEKHEKDADRFIALIDKYENFDTLTVTMLNEFVEKILVHERDRKGSRDTTQEVEIYFNFVGRFVPPAFGEVELTPEELEEIRKKEERKDRLHQNYLKRKANGKQKEYEERTKAKKKAEIEARKAAIRTEDIAKGVFIPVSSLPQREPQKGAKTA